MLFNCLDPTYIQLFSINVILSIIIVILFIIIIILVTLISINHPLPPKWVTTDLIFCEIESIPLLSIQIDRIYLSKWNILIVLVHL